MAKPQPDTKKRANPFAPYNITPETAETAVLLLLSNESEVIVQTLQALIKFCSRKDTANRELIYDYGGIKNILRLIEHPETIIKRFALKLLAQICDLPSAPKQIIHYSLSYIRKIASMLATSQDLFVLEHASSTLAKCTTEQVACEEVIGANVLGVMLNHLKHCIDPDVQKNCLQVLINLLENPKTNAEVTKSSQFSWPPILALLQSRFSVIQQNTLKTLKFLLKRYNDVNVQKSFRASTGVLDLCDILEQYHFRDIHSMVLDTLGAFLGTEENSAHLYNTGCLHRMLDYLEVVVPVMRCHALSVLSKMSFTSNGRKALFETGTDLVFCSHLRSPYNEVQAACAIGIANMCKNWAASAVRLAKTDIVEAISDIIQDQYAPWFDTKLNALLALSVLCRIVYKAACATVEVNNFTALRSINQIDQEIPIEAQRLTLQCYINLQNYNTSIEVMINEDFISEMIETMQRIDTQMKILAATVLSGLMTEEFAKQTFTDKKGEEVIGKYLTIDHIGLRTALCQLIIASVTMDGADIYLGIGTIQYMIENKTARYKVNAWEKALEAIFQHHPSAKLAYTGRLDINDFTTEGFYVMKHIGDKFQTLSEILELPAPYVDPVLIAKFLPTNPSSPSPSPSPSPPPPSLSSVPNMATHWWSSQSLLSIESSIQRFGLPDDSDLGNYLCQLQSWFGDPAKSLQYIEVENAHYRVKYREKCQEVSTSLKMRAQVLGEFVAEQMSGLSQEGECSLPSLESCRRVIGLGFVKYGGPLERAVLYKVLADRLGIPCSFHRAYSAHAWVEVAVPEVDPEEDIKDERYPAGLLRENYIVDLMGKPGKLIPPSSHEARRICGPAHIPFCVARASPAICKCSPQARA